MRSWIVALVSCFAGCACMAQEFEITTIDKDGTLSWTHPYSNGIFQVEWAALPEGPWYPTWEGLVDLTADPPMFLSVPVPVCYRVGWVAEGTRAAAELGEEAGRSRNAGDVEVRAHIFPSLGKVRWIADTDSTYRVEWASSPGGPWFTDWASLVGLAPAVPTASVRVPLYYRMMCAGSCDPTMVYIPAGSFPMGDSFGDGYSDERPVHDVHVSAFLMGLTEVTQAEWDEVRRWALAYGYSFDKEGSGKAADHPVQDIEWYDMVKW